MKLRANRWVKLLFQAVGIALFIVILAHVDLREILRSYRRMSLVPAAIGVALLFILTLIKSRRWKTIVDAQGFQIGGGRAFRVYAASLYLGVVTPGHLGDFAKSLYLMNEGFPAGKALFSSLVDRLFDIMLFVAVGYVSLLFFPGIFENQLLLSSLLVGIVALAAAALFWRRDLLRRFMRRFIAGMPGEGLRSNLDSFITDGLEEFATMRARGAWIVGILTGAAWIVHYLFFIIFAGALGIHATIPVLIVAVSAAVFMSLLPVSISGLGTRDLALILIFSRVGLSREEAVTFSFSFILVYVIQGLTGLVCWFTSPFHAAKTPGRAAQRGEG